MYCNFQIFCVWNRRYDILHVKNDQNLPKKLTNLYLYFRKNFHNYFINILQSLCPGWHFLCWMIFSNMFVDFSTGFWTYPLLLFTLLFHFASDATKLLTIPQNMRGEKLFLQYLTAESNRNSLQVIAKIVQQCQYITFCSPQTVSCESKNSNGLSGAAFLWDDFFFVFPLLNFLRTQATSWSK